MICPANKVGCPAKVVQLTALFSNSKHFFIQLWCQPLASQHHMGGGLRQLTFNDYIMQMITDLKWNINYYW